MRHQLALVLREFIIFYTQCKKVRDSKNWIYSRFFFSIKIPMTKKSNEVKYEARKSIKILKIISKR